MGKCDSDGFFGCDLEFGLYIVNSETTYVGLSTPRVISLF